MPEALTSSHRTRKPAFLSGVFLITLALLIFQIVSLTLPDDHHVITASSDVNRLCVLMIPGFTGEVPSDKLGG
jgi:hypothetical protein